MSERTKKQKQINSNGYGLILREKHTKGKQWKHQQRRYVCGKTYKGHIKKKQQTFYMFECEKSNGFNSNDILISCSTPNIPFHSQCQLLRIKKTNVLIRIPQKFLSSGRWCCDMRIFINLNLDKTCSANHITQSFMVFTNICNAYFIFMGFELQFENKKIKHTQHNIIQFKFLFRFSLLECIFILLIFPILFYRRDAFVCYFFLHFIFLFWCVTHCTVLYFLGMRFSIHTCKYIKCLSSTKSMFTNKEIRFIFWLSGSRISTIFSFFT